MTNLGIRYGGSIQYDKLAGLLDRTLINIITVESHYRSCSKIIIIQLMRLHDRSWSMMIMFLANMINLWDCMTYLEER